MRKPNCSSNVKVELPSITFCIGLIAQDNIFVHLGSWLFPNLVGRASFVCAYASRRTITACCGNNSAQIQIGIKRIAPKHFYQGKHKLAYQCPVKSQAADDLRGGWNPCVNWKTAADPFLKSLKSQRLDITFEAEEFLGLVENSDEAYNSARTVMCNLYCARALARPEPPNQSRRTLVAKARVVVAELGGTVSPELSILMQQADPVANNSV